MNQLAKVDQGQLATVEESVAVSARGLQLRSFEDLSQFAMSVANSGLAPKDFKTPESVLVAIQFGMEIGLSPMQSLHSIAVINGRPVIYGDAALALCTSRPDFEDIIETFERAKDAKDEDATLARCEVKRRGRTPVVRTFSVAQAKKADLWTKPGPWKQYPQRMLQMRARAWALRDAFPDALKGVGIREEVQDIPSREPKPVKAVVLPGDPEPEHPQILPEGHEPEETLF